MCGSSSGASTVSCAAIRSSARRRPSSAWTASTAGTRIIYWRQFADGTVGIVTILHEQMHQMDRFREDSAP